MPLNIPIILKIVLKNIFYRKKWILDDMEKIKTKFKNKTVIVESLDTGLKEIKNCLN